jgi:hypothetical protein
VRPDATLLPQLCPDLPRKSEVRGMVAVQVADLMALDPDPNSPRLPGPASTPGQEVTSSVICSLALCVVSMPSPYKFKCT